MKTRYRPLINDQGHRVSLSYEVDGLIKGELGEPRLGHPIRLAAFDAGLA